MTLIKEWLHQTIAELEEERDATPSAVNEDASMAIAAMKIALGALEAEAVAEWTNEQYLEFLSIAFRQAETKVDLELDDIRLGVKMVNGSRAAMLHGAEHVRQPDEVPMDYLQGHKDGLEWAARLAEANHPQTGDWLYDDPLELAKAIRKGPDMPTASVQGWIPCTERMPEEIGRYWCYVEEQNSLGKSHYQWNCSWNGELWGGEMMYGRVTHWMPLPAAPQQEVK